MTLNSKLRSAQTLAVCGQRSGNRVLEGTGPYHLQVIDAGVDPASHLLPLLGGLGTRVQRRSEPVGEYGH